MDDQVGIGSLGSYGEMCVFGTIILFYIYIYTGWAKKNRTIFKSV